MSVPKYYEMHKPILECLSDGQLHSMKELKAYVIQYFQLTKEDVSSLLPSGAQTYLTNRIGWARTYLKKAGLIESPSRAVFRITKEGMDVLQDNPYVIDMKYLLQYDSFREFVGKDEKADSQSEITDERIDTPEDILKVHIRRSTRVWRMTFWLKS